MAHAVRSLVAFIVAIGTAAFAQPGAALDVRGPDGAQVMVNSSDMHEIVDGELFITGLEPGTHTLRAEVSGYYPYETPLTLAPGQVLAVTLQLQAIQPQTTRTSALLDVALRPTSADVSLQCFPMACQLEIRGENDLAVRASKEFGQDSMMVSGLPAGAYAFTATATVAQERRSTTFEAGLCDGDTLVVFVDFMAIPIVARIGDSAFPNCPELVPNEGTP